MAIARDTGASTFPIADGFVDLNIATRTTPLFSTASASGILILCVGWRGNANVVNPFSVAWTGGTPPGASVWTQVVSAANAVSAPGVIASSIWIASYSQALSNVQVNVSAANAETTQVASISVDALTGASSTITNTGTSFSAGGVVNRFVTLPSVQAGSWLYVASAGDGSAALTDQTNTVKARSDINLGIGGQSEVGYNSSGTSGSIAVGWTGTQDFIATCACEVVSGAPPPPAAPPNPIYEHRFAPNRLLKKNPASRFRSVKAQVVPDPPPPLGSASFWSSKAPKKQIGKSPVGRFRSPSQYAYVVGPQSGGDTVGVELRSTTALAQATAITSRSTIALANATSTTSRSTTALAVAVGTIRRSTLALAQATATSRRSTTALGQATAVVRRSTLVTANLSGTVRRSTTALAQAVGLSRRSTAVQGQATGTTRRSTKASGQATDTSRRSSTASGQATSISRRATTTSGQATNTSRRSTKASGQATDVSRRSTKASGQASDITRRSTVASGQATNTSKRSTTAQSQATGTSRRSTKASGQATDTTRRSTSATANVAGGFVGSSLRSTTASGQATGTSRRSTNAQSQATGTSRRSATAQSNIVATQRRSTTAKGQATGTERRSTKVQSQATNVERRSTTASPQSSGTSRRSTSVLAQATGFTRRSVTVTAQTSGTTRRSTTASPSVAGPAVGGGQFVVSTSFSGRGFVGTLVTGGSAGLAGGGGPPYVSRAKQPEKLPEPKVEKYVEEPVTVRVSAFSSHTTLSGNATTAATAVIGALLLRTIFNGKGLVSTSYPVTVLTRGFDPRVSFSGIGRAAATGSGGFKVSTELAIKGIEVISNPTEEEMLMAAIQLLMRRR